LNLVLVDEENRRYFKQQEITLFRVQNKDEVPLASMPGSPLTSPRPSIVQTGSATPTATTSPKQQQAEPAKFKSPLEPAQNGSN
jgi:hypothetical protein